MILICRWTDKLFLLLKNYYKYKVCTVSYVWIPVYLAAHSCTARSAVILMSLKEQIVTLGISNYRVIILCNYGLSLLTTTLPRKWAAGWVAGVNMINEPVACGSQWFSDQIVTYTRTLEYKVHTVTVLHVCQVFVAEGIRCTWKDLFYSGLC